MRRSVVGWGVAVLALVWFLRPRSSRHEYAGEVVEEEEVRQWLSLGKPWIYELAVVTTCGEGKASHMAGRWKPERLMVGVETMAASLRAAGSEVPLVVVTFASEPKAAEQCEESVILRETNAICFGLDETVTIPKGYGYSKIAAVIAAPARIVMWIDADAYFSSKPEHLFERGKAVFWPDFYGHFDPNAEFWDRVGQEKKKNYSYAQGFDSGLFVVDKYAYSTELNRLDQLARSFSEDYWRWGRQSHGDKDLWHIVWALQGSQFELSPYAGVVVSSSANRTYKLVAQAKCDSHRRVIALHQNWKPIKRHDPSVLFLVDLRMLDNESMLPWQPDISLGLNVTHDPPRFYATSPVPRHIRSLLSRVREAWFSNEDEAA